MDEVASTADMYFSQFRRLASPRSRCLQGLLHGENAILACDGCLLAVCSRGLPSVCVCVETMNSSLSSYKDTNPMASGP